MKRKIMATLATVGLALGLVAVSATPAQADDPIVITAIPAPIQIDNCGPETKAWYSASYWNFGTKVYGLDRYFRKDNTTQAFTVAYTAKPGYVIAPGVQTSWEFPAFTNEPCPLNNGKSLKSAK